MAPSNADIDAHENPPGECADGNARLRAEATDLLLALDRLMTIGTYYKPGHSRYQAVSDQCLEIVRRCLTDRMSLDIEVATDGLRVFDQEFPAESREARRLFALLDPLSLGVLTIRPGVTVQQLQDAIAVIRTRKNDLSRKTSYEEIHLNGMPDNVDALGRTLYLRTRCGGGGSLRGTEAVDPRLITPEMLLAGADLHKSESEFLAIVTGLVKTMGGRTPDQADTGDADLSFDIAKGLPESALKSIEAIISSMVGTNSDPLVFNHLISHARAALEMTGDPELVQLVFEKLRKEAGDKAPPQPKLFGKSAAQKRKSRGPEFSMSYEELDEAIEAITEPYGPVENPEALDRAAALGICLQLLQSSPTDELTEGIHGTLRRIFGAPHFGGPERRATARIAVELFSTRNFEKSAPYFEMYWGLLREYRPEDVGPVWRQIWQDLPPLYRANAWPHTVNDILLGMIWRNPFDALALYGAVSRVKASGNSKLLYALENLPALQAGELADDIFWPPPPLLFPVLHVLIGSSLSAHLGPLLHEHLLNLQTNPLAIVMLEAASEYHPGNRVVYQAILEQGVKEKPTDRMKELAGRMLSLALLRLPPGERRETWIPEAIAWLARLAPDNAVEVLGRIVTEKKFLLIPAWPRTLREAAEAAWLSLDEPKNDENGPDDVGAFTVQDEEADIFAPGPLADNLEVKP